jgi:hypothetical protein
MEERLQNELGQPLPVIFKESGNGVDEDVPEYMSYKTPRQFQKYFTSIEPSSAREDVSARDKEEKEVEVDHYLCCALRCVNQFAPAIIVSQEQEELRDNYLWRAIYPKLPNGKPCYNPAGKYCVRLFLAGKWRRVMVNDDIPLREDGTPALAHSLEEMELWPLLVAKAIYTVYSACGYTSSLIEEVEGSAKIKASMLMKIMKDENNLANTVPSKICYFVSMAVHMLTGWQLNSPMSVTSLFLNEKTRSSALLESITEAGVTKIAHEDIVDSQFDLPTTSTLTETGTDETKEVDGGRWE